MLDTEIHLNMGSVGQKRAGSKATVAAFALWDVRTTIRLFEQLHLRHASLQEAVASIPAVTL